MSLLAALWRTRALAAMTPLAVCMLLPASPTAGSGDTPAPGGRPAGPPAAAVLPAAPDEAALVATAIEPSSSGQYEPAGAVDAAGNAYAVWVDRRDVDAPQVRFAFRPAQGAWSGSAPVAAGSPQLQTYPAIGVDGSGNAYVVWLDGRSGDDQLYFAARAANGTWSQALPVSPSGERQRLPALAVNRRGQAVAAWLDTDGRYAYASFRPVGGPWGPAERINLSAGSLTCVDAGLDDWGRAYALWATSTSRPARYGVYFAVRSPAAGWADAETVRQTSSNDISGARLALDKTGNAHAVWQETEGGQPQVYTSYRPVQGGWTLALVANDTEIKTDYQVHASIAVDGAGNARTAWTDWRHDTTEVYSSVRARGGAWGANARLVPPPAAHAQAAAATGRDAASTLSMLQSEISVSPDIRLGGDGQSFIYQWPSGPGQTGPYNVYWADMPGIGASGDCHGGTMASGASSAAAARPDGLATGPGGGNDRCHAGDASDMPALDWDLTDFVPDSSANPPLVQYPVTHVDADGQTVYVVQVPGHFGMFTTQGEAERYAQEQAERASQEFIGPPAAPPGYVPPEPPTTSPLEPGAMTDAERAEWSALVGGEWQPPAGPNDSGTPVDANGSGPPPMTPQLDAFIRATNLVVTSENRPLTPAEVRQLYQAIAQMDPNSPNREWLLDEYQHNASRWGSAAAQSPAPGQPQQPQQPAPAQGSSPAATQTVGQATNGLTGYYAQQYGQSGGVWNWLRGTKTDPVLAHSGEFVLSRTFLEVPSPGPAYEFHLTYHSQLVYDGAVGWGWVHSYDRGVAAVGGGSLARFDGQGRIDVFAFDGHLFDPVPGRFTDVVSATSGITFTSAMGLVEGYRPLGGSAGAGRLRSISDRNGNGLRLAYDAAGRLTTVTDTFGRTATYTYDANDRIAAVTDATGRQVSLAYDTQGDLVAITSPAVTDTPNGNDFPAGKTTRFVYSGGAADRRLNHNLLQVIDPNETAGGLDTARTVNTYGTQGLAFDRVVGQSWGGGRTNASGIGAGGDVTLEYSAAVEADAPPGAASMTRITDRRGDLLELWHDGAGHRLQARQSVGGDVLTTLYTVNTDGQLTSVTLPAGNRVELQYDEAAPRRRSQGNLVTVRQLPDTARGCDGLGAAPCAPLVTTYAYDAGSSNARSITDAHGNTYSYTYDAHGNLAAVTFPDVTVGTATRQSAAESWSYNAHGQPVEYTDPEGHRTCYEYVADGPAAGQPARVEEDCGGLGVATEYAYDQAGRLASVTDGRGIRTDYAVNQLGQVTRIARAAAVGPGASQDLGDPPVPLDYETLYRYDADDHLVQIDRENVVPELDADFHPTGRQARDEGNPWFTTSYTYDLLGDLVQVVDEVTATTRVTTRYRYDAEQNLVAVTRPSGRTEEFGWDERGLLSAITQGGQGEAASVVQLERDPNGNVVRVIDGEGHPTDYAYDGFDRLAGRVDPLGNVRRWRRDATDGSVQTVAEDGQDGRNPARALDATAAVTLSREVTRFDERRRPYEVRRAMFVADPATGATSVLHTDGDGDGWAVYATERDRNGRPIVVLDDNGAADVFTYDGLGRLSTWSDPLGNTSVYQYDGNGEVVRIDTGEKQPEGLAPDRSFTWRYAYDAADRISLVEDNLHQTSQYAYDSLGRLVFASDSNPAGAGGHGNTTVWAYDALGRLLTEDRQLRSDGTGGGALLGHVTQRYAYDEDGRVVATTDPNGHRITYGYDALGRLATATDAAGATASYQYDRASRLVRQVDANGSVAQFSLDGLGRRTETAITPAPGVGGTRAQTFVWDGLSRLAAATDGNDPANPDDDSTLAYTYDSLSHRVKETENGHLTRSTFDGVGNRLSLEYPGGLELTFTYDPLGRPKVVADGTDTVATYDYIGPLCLARRLTGDGATTALSYDGAGRLVTLSYTQTSDGTPLASFGYTYDATGHRTSEHVGPADRLTTYTYDSLYRLVQAHGPAGATQFAYDAAGNRTETARAGEITAYTANATDQYQSVGSDRRTYDRNGNLTRVARGGAPAGPLQVFMPIAESGRRGTAILAAFAVGASGYQSGWTGQAATQPVTESLTAYTYDAFDRMVGAAGAVTVTAGSDGQRQDWSVAYAYDVFGRVVERRSQGGVEHYVYGADRLLEVRDDAGRVAVVAVAGEALDAGGRRLYARTDGLGSVRALVDGASGVTVAVDYDAFGQPVALDDMAAALPAMAPLFGGQLFDGDVGLYVVGGRRYDPDTGRFLQRGRDWFANPYVFAGNNPTWPVWH